MAKIRVLVVEDESIVSKDIQRSLERLGYEIAGAVSTGEKAIEVAEKERPDIILMDIMLKGEMSGIEAADTIKSKHHVPVVFLTAYADQTTLNNAKITEPHGYILKPFKEVDLNTTIEVALYKHQKEEEIIRERDLLYSLVEGKSTQNFIFVKANSKLVKLRTQDIYFVEALKDYVVINTLEKRYTIHSSMKAISDKLNDDEFIRVHRSFIVRIDKIEAIEFPNLHLENDKKTIPIGGSYREDLQKKIFTV